MNASYSSKAITATHLATPAGSPDVTRRKFLASAGVAAAGLTILKPGLVAGTEANSKIDIGVIGCGGRGAWIAELLDKNGHYNVVGVADYFQDRVDVAGDKLKVPSSKRFTGLSGYKRLLEEKVDAVAIISPPYFHPEQAAAAVEAGERGLRARDEAVEPASLGDPRVARIRIELRADEIVVEPENAVSPLRAVTRAPCDGRSAGSTGWPRR